MKTMKCLGVSAALAVLLAGVPAFSQTLPLQSLNNGQAAPDSQVYVLGPGDQVRVTVFGEDRLSGTFSVNTNGELSFPLIGNLLVNGRSVADLQSIIRDRLAAGYVKDPRVAAEVLSFRPFYVLGEVARPGQYPYVNGLTLQQAIATAGGYTYRAKRRVIYVKPATKPDEVAVDTKKQTGVFVAPGDTLRVGERFF